MCRTRAILRFCGRLQFPQNHDSISETRCVEMVLTKQELIGALQNEVRIFLHLAGKIDRNKLDYRPAPKQRSTIELLRYMSVMGPTLLKAIKAGAFDQEGFQAAMTEANAMNFDQVLGAIENQRGA